MARRFGRNQKRALRREIERQAEVLRYAEKCHARLARELDSARDQRNRLSHELAFCKEALGEEFIGFGPVDAAMNARRAYGRPSFRVHVGGDQAQVLHVLDAKAYADSKDPAHQIHFMAELAGSDVAYCISEAALRQAPDHVVIQQIAHALAEHLVHDIREKRGIRR